MIVLALITYGFGLLCCIGIAVPVVALFKAIRRIAPKATGLKILTYGYATLSGVLAAYVCWLIVQTCWQLLTVDGGPGPFGLLAFPFWAAMAVVPALVGLGLLRLLGRYPKS
jgi:hypothetical protein